jgi:hypothetical protein
MQIHARITPRRLAAALAVAARVLAAAWPQPRGTAGRKLRRSRQAKLSPHHSWVQTRCSCSRWRETGDRRQADSISRTKTGWKQRDWGQGRLWRGCNSCSACIQARPNSNECGGSAVQAGAAMCVAAITCWQRDCTAEGQLLQDTTQSQCIESFARLLGPANKVGPHIHLDSRVCPSPQRLC